MAESGKVVHYDTNRGFGFLAPDTGGADVFLHINDIDIDENLLKPGAKVEFDIEETDRGTKAINLAVTEEAADDHSHAPRGDRRDRHDHGRGGDRHDRGPRGPRARGGRGGSGPLDSSAFTEEVTELLLDSADDLTAAQIVAIRQNITDFAVARGWVLD